MKKLGRQIRSLGHRNLFLPISILLRDKYNLGLISANYEWRNIPTMDQIPGGSMETGVIRIPAGLFNAPVFRMINTIHSFSRSKFIITDSNMTYFYRVRATNS